MSSLRLRPTIVWAVLMACTIAMTWLLRLLGLPLRDVMLCVMAIAAVKVALVAFEFMELRRAPRWMRAVTICWIAGVALMIVAFHLVTP